MKAQIPDEQWQAILQNNADYDHQFYYAVKTTGIFCRPSCKSKPPNKDNVSIFRNADEALSAGYRPCKRCKPTGQRLPDAEWAEQISRFIDGNFQHPISLQMIADTCHGSPYHLHRIYKRVTGYTPAEYIHQKRLETAKESLRQSDTAISAIAGRVGMPNFPYFVTWFKKNTGYTPAAYRESYRNRWKEEV
ncbi:bifunctional transcriptional activator/DNA repair enzyme AdaA [Paenibacillus guangzhouensis]|uniref:bifunctional transcriptional activator/DNA repair enzyme AdaA n=1 Tax=Paenibacillus guangzhouensis TaxID=1473112 RepID=UPI001266B8EE|nr:bifunctional transcriptional activator/DNA repair enzyme AdaA [Paenibacillus guangzhouensis]